MDIISSAGSAHAVNGVVLWDNAVDQCEQRARAAVNVADGTRRGLGKVLHNEVPFSAVLRADDEALVAAPGLVVPSSAQPCPVIPIDVCDGVCRLGP